MDQAISSLDLPKNVIEQLQQLGYNFCKDLSNCTQFEFSCEQLQSAIGSNPTQSALEIYKEECLNGCILTFINKDLDDILMNEVIPGRIVEFTGYSGSGKTQICYYLSISVQLPKCCGGLEGETIFICTNNNFAPQRLKEIALIFVANYEKLENVEKSNDFNSDTILNKIYLIQTVTEIEFLAAIKHLGEFFKNGGKNVRLLMIDSISYPIRQIDPNERTAIIQKIMRRIHKLANLYKFAVVISNDLTTRMKNDQAHVTPSFGDSFYHCVNTRILLSKTNLNQFNAKIIKSVNNPVKIANFAL